ncbi:SuhB: inositol-1-monophosphatase [Desulfosarcina variabilis str. Montpellier]|uniref:inositol monophosphatase family protein n=1 Tax=Desulfosarcina variabilis TaxID=2300 RepID=UPI003AFA6A37
MTPDIQTGLGKNIAPVHHDRIVATAEHAARLAGEIQMKAFRRESSGGSVRLLHDIKLETDRHCEGVIIETIRQTFPDHAILTEESGALPGSGGYTWVVDPLDGTVNFSQGIPFFCVSIACYRNGAHDSDTYLKRPTRWGQPIVGVVYLPSNREMFAGIAGHGAFLNERPIRISQVNGVSDAVVSMSFGKTPEVMQIMTRRLNTLLPRIRKARCLGAAAAELAYAAAGYLAGVFYEGIRQWDFAASKILLTEAGGFFEAEEIHADHWRVWAGTPALQASLGPVLKG